MSLLCEASYERIYPNVKLSSPFLSIGRDFHGSLQRGKMFSIVEWTKFMEPQKVSIILMQIHFKITHTMVLLLPFTKGRHLRSLTIDG